MKNVITGKSCFNISELDEVMVTLSERTRSFRFVHDLEKFTVAAIEFLLRDAGIPIPAGTEDIALYLGIDNAIEDIKNEFWGNIVKDGILGASPLLFPFTSPNALAAQATIVLDLRGESVVSPVKGSIDSIIEYADECMSENYISMAIAGGITSPDMQSDDGAPDYQADFFFIENPESARNRGARIYGSVQEVFV